MQKKQLRTIAIIALVAVFVIASIMRLTIEPADLGKGDTPGGSQVVEVLPTDDEQPGSEQPADGGVTGDEQPGDEQPTGGDVTGDEQPADGNGDAVGTDEPADTVKDEPQQAEKPVITPATTPSATTPTTDKPADTTPADTPEKPASSAETGTKPGAWPPIPEQAVADPNNPRTFHCTMNIVCTTLLNEENIDNEAIIPYIPKDGIILPTTTIEFTEGQNAFDIILKACRANDIQFEFREDALYSGAYVEGINYIYEFDGGGLSGWMYKVNGQFPNYGCKRYIVQDGDEIVWMYTCDLGRDVGDNSVW